MLLHGLRHFLLWGWKGLLISMAGISITLGKSLHNHCHQFLPWVSGPVEENLVWCYQVPEVHKLQGEGQSPLKSGSSSELHDGM